MTALFSKPPKPQLPPPVAPAPTVDDPAVQQAEADARRMASQSQGMGSLITNTGGAGGLMEQAPVFQPSLIAGSF